MGDAGQGGRTDPSPQHTRVCKVNFSLSWRGRGEPPSPPPQVAGAGAVVPGPLRKGALPPGLHPAPTAGERVGNWVSGPVGSLGSASLFPDSQLCPFHHPAEGVLLSTPDRSTQMGRGPGLRFVSSNLGQGAWSEPGLGHLFRSQAEGGWGCNSLPSAPHSTPVLRKVKSQRLGVPERAIATSEDITPTPFHRWKAGCSGEMCVCLCVTLGMRLPLPEPVSPSVNILDLRGSLWGLMRCLKHSSSVHGGCRYNLQGYRGGHLKRSVIQRCWTAYRVPVC